MEKMKMIGSITNTGKMISSPSGIRSDRVRHLSRVRNAKILFTTALAAAIFLFVIPMGAGADYEAGKHEWDAGRPAEALVQWQAAAGAGDRRAMLELGRMYRRGLGVVQDFIVAHMWLNLAAARGDIEAFEEREVLAEKMTAGQIAEAQIMAREWKPDGGDIVGESTDSNMATQPIVDSERVLVVSGIPREAIREAQTLLAALGYEPGDADGEWSDPSVQAYIEFQRNSGLPEVDELTPKTLIALRNAVVEQERLAKEKAEQERLAKQKAEREREKFRRLYADGKEFRDCDSCPVMVVIPAGTFRIGSPESEKGRYRIEGPLHEVKFAAAFAAGKFEVTFNQWETCVSEGGCSREPYDMGWGRGKRPVISVSWHDTSEYVDWLSQKTGKQYRLLSESEWEYATRAGTTGPFHFGSTISTEQANYNGNYTYGGGQKGVYRDRTVPVGSFSANEFGLHDLHGNVWEWVEDCWHDSYSGAPSDGSAWISGGNCEYHVLRGGSWDDGPRNVRSANRVGGEAGFRSIRNGFRVARTLAP